MNKLTEKQVREANKLLKVLVVKTKDIDPDVVASAVIGLCARMCFVASCGDIDVALGFAENMALDIQAMTFNLNAAYKIQEGVRNEAH